MDDYTWDGGTAPDWRKRAEAALAEAREVYARFEHDTLLEPLAREGMEQAAQQQAAATAARVQELERENAELVREVAGLRYYVRELERNVTQEERAYAAGVASLLLSQQAVQP